MLNDVYHSPFTIKGQQVSLDAFKNSAILVVNTATQCGLTGQLVELEALHQEFGNKGLKVIGFPCNQFKNQEPVGDGEMANVCQLNYGVTFDFSHKLEVNGKNAHPLFSALKSYAPGFAGSQSIKWNFTKFLIAPNGQSIERFAPITKPHKLKKAIENLLR